MKTSKIFAVIIIFVLLLYPVTVYAGNPTIGRMLAKLSNRRLTSLQKLELIEQYKGDYIKGSGRVRDVLKSFGSKNEAMVYIDKYYRGNKYEIVLMIGQDMVEDIKKGRAIRFEGKFVGMTFRTLRFKDAAIMPRMWWFF